jgi:hypothetical protein
MRSMRSAMSGCAVPRSSAHVEMAVRKMKVKMQRTAQERKRGKGKAHNKTDQIKEFPVHD